MVYWWILINLQLWCTKYEIMTWTNYYFWKFCILEWYNFNLDFMIIYMYKEMIYATLKMINRTCVFLNSVTMVTVLAVTRQSLVVVTKTVTLVTEILIQTSIPRILYYLQSSMDVESDNWNCHGIRWNDSIKLSRIFWGVPFFQWIFICWRVTWVNSCILSIVYLPNFVFKTKYICV